MLRISVREVVGENAMTLDDGEAVYHCLHKPLLSGETVELNFDGVEVFASPFFNVAIAKLLADLTPDVLNTRLRIASLSPLGDRILRRVIENAKDYYSANEEHRRAVDRIVRDAAANM